VGGGGALAMLTGEIRNVIENIEKIPGVPASTVASVQQARYAFQSARVSVDQAIAGIVSFTSWTARAAGFVGGALVYGLEDAERAYWDFGRAAELAATAQERQAAAAKKAAEETAAGARVLAYATSLQDKSIAEGTAAMERHAKAKEAFDHKDETAIQRMNRLRAEANKVLNAAGTGGSEAEVRARVTAQAGAYEGLTEAAKLEKQLTEEAGKHLQAWNDFYDLIGDSGVSEAIKNNAAYAAEDATKAAQDMGWAFQSAFEDAILGGEKFSDVLKGLAQDVLRIAIRSAITAPLGNWVSGMVGSMFGGGKASGGPVNEGTSYLVGEKGPEMFTPRTSGNITPNHALQGGGGGDTYFIDARGADRTGLSRLEGMIRQVNGSIEHRAIGAVMDFRRRGATA
jgi:phage-related minor tail protein/copper chaperone CopZ